MKLDLGNLYNINKLKKMLGYINSLTVNNTENTHKDLILSKPQTPVRKDIRVREKLKSTTYTSNILSPFRIPARCAAPPSKTALTCCKGAYNTPFIDFSTPPSLTWPLTLKPNPVSDFVIVTSRGFPGSSSLMSGEEGGLLSSLSAILCHVIKLENGQFLESLYVSRSRCYYLSCWSKRWRHCAKNAYHFTQKEGWTLKRTNYLFFVAQCSFRSFVVVDF